MNRFGNLIPYPQTNNVTFTREKIPSSSTKQIYTLVWEHKSVANFIMKLAGLWNNITHSSAEPRGFRNT